MKTNITKEIEMYIDKNKTKNEIYINEFTIRGDKFNLIYDAITLDIKTNLIIGREIKVSKSDFNNLYRKLLDRDHNYDIYVDKFYICVPLELEEYAKTKITEWSIDIAYVRNIGLKVYDHNTNQLKNKISAKSNERYLYTHYMKNTLIYDIMYKWIEVNK